MSQAVQSYLALLSILNVKHGVRIFGQAHRNSGVPETIDGIDGLSRGLKLAPAARIYEIDGGAVEDSLLRMEQVVAESYEAAPDPETWRERWVALADEVAFPVLPFPVMWVGFSQPIDTSRLSAHALNAGPSSPGIQAMADHIGIPPDVLSEHVQQKALGFFTVETGENEGVVIWIYENSLKGAPRDVHPYYECSLICDPERSWAPIARYTGVWAVTLSTISAIARSQVIEQGVGAATRYLWGKGGGHKIGKARPWYKVNLHVSTAPRSNASIETETADQLGRAIRFRHDRRAHERLFLHRGELPLDNARREQFAARGYALWVDHDPDENVSELMELRGHEPKKPGEWIATRIVRIEATVVGDEALPYYPGVRTR